MSLFIYETMSLPLPNRQVTYLGNHPQTAIWAALRKGWKPVAVWSRDNAADLILTRRVWFWRKRFWKGFV